MYLRYSFFYIPVVLANGIFWIQSKEGNILIININMPLQKNKHSIINNTEYF